MLKKTTVIVAKLLIFMMLIGFSIIMVAGTGFSLLYASADIPDRTTTHPRGEITFITSDGEKVGAIQPPDGVIDLKSKKAIPDVMKKAVIASEDADYMEHHGVNPKRILSAAYQHAQGNPGGGASTITQQYVKNTIVGDEVSIARKIKEAAYAMKLDKTRTKDEILSDYLNLVYYGRGSYGLQEAAKNFFNKDSSDLNINESALLAGLIQSPSALDPDTNREGAEQRLNYVVNRMKEEEFIPSDTVIEFPELAEKPEPGITYGVEGEYGHIINQALIELERNGYDRQSLHNNSATINLTINNSQQQQVSDIARNNISGNLRTGIATVNSADGSVIAYYGGDDGLGLDYASTEQMTGSTFKVFALTAAMEQGISPGKSYSSSPYEDNGHTVYDAGSYTGNFSVERATSNSLNTVYMRIQDDIGGPQETQNMAHRMGVSRTMKDGSPSLGGDTPYKSIVLGSYQTSVLDMANAYGTLASGGNRHTAHFVSHVTNYNGVTMFESNYQSEPVLNSDTVNKTDEILKTSAKANGDNGRTKTGTTQLGDTGNNRDAWNVGYHPGGYSTAVWVGTDNGDPLFTAGGAEIWGATVPSNMWRSVMSIY